MAEEHHAKVSGRANLVGAENYWSMVIHLRSYLFQVRTFLCLLEKSADNNASVVLLSFNYNRSLPCLSCLRLLIVMFGIG